MSKPSFIRVAVIGDSGVGKTSLIIALANESFPTGCPPVLPAVTMPAEQMPDGMPLQVIDTCSRPEERAVLEQTCLNVDVILLLFAAASLQSLKRIETHWLPDLRRIGVHVPILLVASKMDLANQDTDGIHALADPVVSKFKGTIDSCQNCSAKLLKNVSEVFYYAVKAVINPLAPIFNPEAENGDGALTTLCAKALKRIFLINDRDKDGALSDEELNRFQMDVFSAPLQPEELHGIHGVVSSEMPQGVTPAGLTLPGFLYLNSLFIEKGQLETVWSILRTYGYNNDILLDVDVLSEINFARVPDQVVELTEACVNYLSEKFVDFDEDGDKLLSAAEQAAMFSTAPSSPWRDAESKSLLVEVGTSGQETDALTLQGFLAKWVYTAAVDPERTLAYLRYLGFEGSAAPLFRISKFRRQERHVQQLQRSVIQGLVVLGSRVGRGVLLKALAGRPADDADLDSHFSAAGEVMADHILTTGRAKTVILREVEAEDLARLKQEQGAVLAADFAVFTFSTARPDSIRETEACLLELAEAADNTLPCVLMSFEDQESPAQNAMEECGAMVAELDLRLPIEISSGSQSDLQSALQSLLQIAEAPDKMKAIPQTPSLKAKKEYQRTLRRTLYVLGGGVIAGAAIYAVYKALQRPGDAEAPLLESGHPEFDASHTIKNS